MLQRLRTRDFAFLSGNPSLVPLIRHISSVSVQKYAKGKRLVRRPKGRGGIQVEDESKLLNVMAESKIMVAALSNIGIKQPTVVQQESIPLTLDHLRFRRYNRPDPLRLNIFRDSVILSSHTGSGKTYGFIIPIIDDIIAGRTASAFSYEGIHSVILVPSTELAVQITSVINQFIGNINGMIKKGKPIGVLMLNEFTNFSPDKIKEDIARKQHDILVTTPAAFLKAFKKKSRPPKIYSLETPVDEHLDLGPEFRSLRCVVVDEVDQVVHPPSKFKRDDEHWEKFHIKYSNGINCLNCLLQLGDPLLIISSATVNNPLKNLMKRMGWGWRLSVANGDVNFQLGPEAHREQLPRSIHHRFIVVPSTDVLAENISHLHNVEGKPPTMVMFPSTFPIRNMASELHALGKKIYFLHNLMNTYPAEASKVLNQVNEDFKNGKFDMILTSFRSARGIDFPWLKNVYMVTSPADASMYIHCAGRTGRMGKSGTATTFLSEDTPILKNGGSFASYLQIMKYLRLDPERLSIPGHASTQEKK